MIYAALFGWPIVTAIVAFRTYWPVAVLVSLFGGYLLLPENHGINLPLIPTFDKHTIPSITLLLLALLIRPGQANREPFKAAPAVAMRPGWLPRTKFGLVLVLMFPAGAIMTALTNGDQITIGPRILPSMSLYDGFATIVAATSMFIPLLLGRKYFAGADMHRLLVVGFAIAAFIYSFPTLYEVRMSPQLNNTIYGFFPHSWLQHIRGDGFRPIVFLQHGLRLSLFLAMGVLAALAVYRLSTGPIRTLALVAAAWLLMALVLSKSLGALMITVLIAPVILFLSARMQLLAAACIAGMVLTYPMLRSAGYAPIAPVLNIAENIDPARARSFAFRLEHEDALLAKVAERPLFGWGGWGRNLLWDEETGGRVSVTDGTWIISFSMGGWVEYIAKFGLLTLPVLLLALRRRQSEVEPATAALAVILMANAIDLLPNSGATPIMWLMAGALLGRLELGRETTGENTQAPDAARLARVPGRPAAAGGGLVYTRQTEWHHRTSRSR